MPNPASSVTTTSHRKHDHWRWYLGIIAIGLLSLALRWYYVATAVVLNPVRGDAVQYYTYAWNLVHHGIFSKNLPGAARAVADNYRDPGYPFFLSLWMRLLGAGDSWYEAVLLCQAVLGSLTVVFATLLGRYWLPAAWAWAAGFAMAVWPHNITIDGFLLSETLFGFLCSLGMLLLASACKTGNPARMIIAGMTIGAAALTNAVLLPFGVLLAALLAWRCKAPARLCTALALGALLLPGAWAIRNAQLPASAHGESSSGRALQNLVQGSWTTYHSAWRRANSSDDEDERAQAKMTLADIDKEVQAMQASRTQGLEMLWRRMSPAPVRYVTWYLFQKPYELWAWDIQIGQGDIFVYPTSNAPFQTQPAWIALGAIGHALNPWLALLALGGLISAWCVHGSDRTGQASLAPFPRTVLFATACLPAYATLVYVALQAEPRYAIPFRAFELLLATTCLHRVAGWWQRRRHITHTS